jgi:hypothetical protein
MRSRTSFRFTAVITFAVLGASICYAQTPSVEPTKQPVAPVRAVTDDYYGTKIVDNYRYFSQASASSTSRYREYPQSDCHRTKPRVPTPSSGLRLRGTANTWPSARTSSSRVAKLIELFG